MQTQIHVASIMPGEKEVVWAKLKNFLGSQNALCYIQDKV